MKPKIRNLPHLYNVHLMKFLEFQNILPFQEKCWEIKEITDMYYEGYVELKILIVSIGR